MLSPARVALMNYNFGGAPILPICFFLPFPFFWRELIVPPNKRPSDWARPLVVRTKKKHETMTQKCKLTFS